MLQVPGIGTHQHLPLHLFQWKDTSQVLQGGKSFHFQCKVTSVLVVPANDSQGRISEEAESSLDPYSPRVH